MRISHIKLAGGAATALAAFLVSLKPIVDPDIWWHLAAGRWVAENGAWVMPTRSITTPGVWSSATWLYDLLVWWVSSQGRCLGNLTYFHAVLVGLALGWAWFTFTESVPYASVRGFAAAALCFFFAILLCDPRFRQRPEVFSYLCASAMQYLLLRSWRRRPAGVWRLEIAFCFLVQVLWSNTHGLCLMGPFMAGMLLVSRWIEKREFKAEALVLFGVCSACLLTPRGLSSLSYPFHLLNTLASPHFQNYISEARPLFFRFEVGYWEIAFVLWLALTAGAFAGAGFSGMVRRFSWLAAVQPLVLAVFALMARRNVPFLVVATLPMVSVFVFSVCSEKLASPRRRLAGVALFLAAGGFFLKTGRLAAADEFFGFSSDVPPYFYPDNAIVFLESLPKGSRIFTDPGSSDYLLFKSKHHESYIDTRYAEIHGPDQMKRYLEIINDPKAAELDFKEKKINSVLVSANRPELFPLAKRLIAGSNWKLGYFDETAIVVLGPGLESFGRSEIDFEYFIAKRREAAVGARAWFQSASLAQVAGKFEVAERLVAPTLEDAASAYRGWNFICALRVNDGYKNPEQPCRKAIEAGPSEVAPFRMLLAHFLSTGEVSSAIGLLKQQEDHGLDDDLSRATLKRLTSSTR